MKWTQTGLDRTRMDQAEQWVRTDRTYKPEVDPQNLQKNRCETAEPAEPGVDPQNLQNHG